MYKTVMICLVVLEMLAGTAAYCQKKSELPPWTKGYFDIHHISTGRGNSAFLVFPDGTTMLIDAGDISDTHPRTTSPRNGKRRPDDQHPTHFWIADYIRQFMPAGRAPALDYAMITHFHDDHFGEWDEHRALSANGVYRLTGIMGVGDLVPVRMMIDRGFDFPIDLRSQAFEEREKQDEYHIVQTLHEYWKFIAHHTKNGMKHETLRAGAKDQIVLKQSAQSYLNFSVRNVYVNGQVWTGYADNDYMSLFRQGQYPGENPLSTGLRFSYGKFDYFTGGDIAGMNALGESDPSAVEAHVAPVIGAVDVATLNHHGNRDSQSPGYVRALRPRVWIAQCWSSDHPGDDVLRRLTSESLYPGPRDLFTTDMLEANRLVIGDRLENSFRNTHGHIVVRVFENGSRYQVFVLDDFSPKREVLSSFGPFESR